MYNVLTEPWVSVLDAHGCLCQVSLLDVIQHADQYTMVSYPMAMVESSVLLFLINFVTDAYVVHHQNAVAMDDDDEWDDGDNKPVQFPRVGEHIDMAVIDAYVHHCLSEGVSFDLFDPVKPFMQMWGNDPEGALEPIAKIVPNVPYGNNSKFIENCVNPKTLSCRPADVLPLLITYARYAPAQGGCEAKSNLNGDDLLFFFRKGKNLLDTILLNIIRVGRGGNSVATQQYGTPWYRCMDKVVENTSFPDNQLGWLNGTFFMRHVFRLIYDENGISQVLFRYGIKVKNDQYPTWRDPYQMYVDYGNDKVVRFKSGDFSEFCYNEHLILNTVKNLCVTETNVFGLIRNTDISDRCDMIAYMQTQRGGASVISDKREDVTIPHLMFDETDEGLAYRTFVQDCVSAMKPMKDILKKHLKKAFISVHLYTDSDNKEMIGSIDDFLNRDFASVLHQKFAWVLQGADLNLTHWNACLLDVTMKTWDKYVSRFSSKAFYRVPFFIERQAVQRDIMKKLHIS